MEGGYKKLFVIEIIIVVIENKIQIIIFFIILH